MQRGKIQSWNIAKLLLSYLFGVARKLISDSHKWSNSSPLVCQPRDIFSIDSARFLCRSSCASVHPQHVPNLNLSHGKGSPFAQHFHLTVEIWAIWVFDSGRVERTIAVAETGDQHHIWKYLGAAGVWHRTLDLQLSNSYGPCVWSHPSLNKER